MHPVSGRINAPPMLRTPTAMSENEMPNACRYLLCIKSHEGNENIFRQLLTIYSLSIII